MALKIWPSIILTRPVAVWLVPPADSRTSLPLQRAIDGPNNSPCDRQHAAGGAAQGPKRRPRYVRRLGQVLGAAGHSQQERGLRLLSNRRRKAQDPQPTAAADAAEALVDGRFANFLPLTDNDDKLDYFCDVGRNDARMTKVRAAHAELLAARGTGGDNASGQTIGPGHRPFQLEARRQPQAEHHGNFTRDDAVAALAGTLVQERVCKLA